MNTSTQTQLSSTMSEESITIASHLLVAVLICLCICVHLWAQRTKSQVSSGNNPHFIQFQRQFLVVYCLALFSDWLQGPYIYKLYSFYGFAESQIAVLYVVGFAASVLFGTGTGILADQFGRKKMCIAFSIMYSLCCLTKLSRNFNVLLIGRVFGGIATSMLFSTFESWYVYEHVERHDFPTEWLPVSFSKITFWNGVVAINAGVAANVAVDGFGFGPAAPFMLAIPFLVASGGIVWKMWPENYGNKLRGHVCTSCKEGLRVIIFNESILLLGTVQSLFESVMYMFVFLWTPVLDPIHPPLGMVFSCFMVCIMIGSSTYQIFLSRGFDSVQTLTVAIFLGFISMCACVVSTNTANQSVFLSFAAFLLLEFSIGLYFPSVGFLRSRVIPEAHRANIMNWFNVPMNLLTCGGLLWLHHEDNRYGNQSIFVICVFLLLFALLAVKYLGRCIRKEEVALEQSASPHKNNA